MKAHRLPYDMGNAGDLIKHGLIAEFAEWWLAINKSDFAFLDPFGGRPYVSAPRSEVIRRIQQIPDCALKRGQPDAANRYCGSGNVVKIVSANINRSAVIKVSDRDQLALHDLLNEGFESIHFDGFDMQESFSIVDCEMPSHFASLLLLDPFDDFLPEYANSIVPRLQEFISNSGLPVVLFVLCEDWENKAGKKWQHLRDRYLSPNLTQLSLVCPKLPKSMIKGETNFNSEVVLLLPHDYGEGYLANLKDRLHGLSVSLTEVLDVDVVFNSRGIL